MRAVLRSPHLRRAIIRAFYMRTLVFGVIATASGVLTGSSAEGVLPGSLIFAGPVITVAGQDLKSRRRP